MKIKKYQYFLLCAALLSAPAMAINKCIGPDGHVTYQESACPVTAKGSQAVQILDSKSNAVRTGWRFVRKDDEMTEKVGCFAMSAEAYASATHLRLGAVPVHMVVVVTSDTEMIGLRSSDNKTTFHNNIQGMGVRTNNGPFIPFTVRAGSHAVGIDNDAALIDMLEESTHLQVRVRFWPYEQLHDATPISSEGFTTALQQARSCAGR